MTRWATAPRRRSPRSTPGRRSPCTTIRCACSSSRPSGSETSGIAAIPDEVFALTGLKIKARSPLRSTFTIELANGSEGYIPPPEQHALGGYTTWPARTAALEVEAEPRIVEAVLGLLEQVAGTPRRKDEPAETAYSKAVHAAQALGLLAT